MPDDNTVIFSPPKGVSFISSITGELHRIPEDANIFSPDRLMQAFLMAELKLAGEAIRDLQRKVAALEAGK